MKNPNKIIMYNNWDNNHVAIVSRGKKRLKKENDNSRCGRNSSNNNIIIGAVDLVLVDCARHNLPIFFICCAGFRAFVRKRMATPKTRYGFFFDSNWLNSMHFVPVLVDVVTAKQLLTIAERLLKCNVSAVPLSVNELH